jgi:hypothetical protein
MGDILAGTGRTAYESVITVPAYREGRGRGYFDKARGENATISTELRILGKVIRPRGKT